MILDYLVVCYAILIENGQASYVDEPNKKLVPKEYVDAVKKYLNSK